MTRSANPDAQRLLADIGWVRKLARSLVDDPDLAEDLAQDAWLIFLRRAPDESRPLRPWFRTVIANLRRHVHRGRARREARERERASPEAQPGTGDVFERKAIQRDLVEAVLALEEPYRSTVLARYLEDSPPREIARRQGVPVRTVNTRLRRGLAQLRARLDHEHGADRARRAAWLASLLRLAAEERAAAPRMPLVPVGAIALLALMIASWFLVRHDGSSNAAAPTLALEGRSDRVASVAREPREAVSSAQEAAPSARAGRLASSIVGVVVDGSGVAIGGATVELVDASSPRLERSNPPLARPRARVATTVSDAAGAFAFDARLGRRFAVRASAPGFAAATETSVRVGETARVVLDRAARLALRVVREDGEPLASARVRLLDASGRVELAAANCDARGEATLLDLAALRGVVEAVSADRRWIARAGVSLAALDPTDPIDALELVATPSAGVRGIVHGPRGAPLASATVRAADAPDLAVRTGGDGRFELLGLPPTRAVALEARCDGYAVGRASVSDASSSDGELAIELAPARTLAGRAVDLHGAPIPGARVIASFDRTGGEPRDFDRVETRTAGDGSFELAGLRLDVDHDLAIHAHGFGVASRAVAAGSLAVSEHAELERIDLGDLALEPAASIDGALRDERGAPLADVDVQLFRLGERGKTLASVARARGLAPGRSWDDARTDALGRFAFDDLPAGAWVVVCGEDTGIERARAEVDLLGGATVAVELTSLRGATWSGRVLDVAGAPVAGALVEALRDGRAPVRARTRDDGRFTLVALEGSSYAVRITPPRDELAELAAPSTALATGLWNDVVIADAPQAWTLGSAPAPDEPNAAPLR